MEEGPLSIELQELEGALASHEGAYGPEHPAVATDPQQIGLQDLGGAGAAH